MINQFISWWGRQLLTLLPDAVRGPDADVARAILITHVATPGSLPDTVDVMLPKTSFAVTPERIVLDEDGLAGCAPCGRVPRVLPYAFACGPAACWSATWCCR